jgi:hypothetical protein
VTASPKERGAEKAPDLAILMDYAINTCDHKAPWVWGNQTCAGPPNFQSQYLPSGPEKEMTREKETTRLRDHERIEKENNIE